MPHRPLRWSIALVLALASACKSDGPTIPNGALEVGQSLNVTGAQDVRLEAGASTGEYSLVLVNTGLTAGVTENYSLRGDGIIAPTGYVGVDGGGGPTLARLALRGAEGAQSEGPPVADNTFEANLRSRERAELSPRFASAQGWYRSRNATASTATAPTGFAIERRAMAIPSTVKVGDTVTVNVNGNQGCTNPLYHRARVVVISQYAIVLADTANPIGGFTDADYQRFATKFDTLVYPLDVAAFGQPTDIDGNAHIALVFTAEVNRLTPPNSNSFVGGFTFSRDLFPIIGTPRAQACAASNEGEYFYLLTPDPFGTINGNRRSTGFVDSNTTAVIAHELQHLINSSRRLYVNNAPAFEEKWLDEGVAHIAEELLFYREAGLSPRLNLGIADIRSSSRRTTAFNLDMIGGGNVGRYRTYLLKPSTSSPYADGDSLTTRGAAWNLLRYLADQAATNDGDIFYRLANGPSTGFSNLKAVFGDGIQTKVRDWSVSHAVDDVVTAPALQQPSWNWRSIYTTLYGGYPLAVQPMTNGTSYSGAVVAGGATFFRLAVPASANATISLGGQSGSAGSNLQLVIVRIR